MIRNQKIVTVFGGTGFLGRLIVQKLARAGYAVKVATRSAEKAYFLKPFGTVGQIVPVSVDYNDRESIERAIHGSWAVINCIGILYERRKNRFQRLHSELPATIATVCKKKNVRHFVHISALGVENNRSRYAKTKLEGEQKIRTAFPDAVILRPSVLFGPGDNFFNMFAELARYVPVLPLIGGGKTKFQPVYVGDVASAALATLHPSTNGQTYALGGPEVVTFRQIYERLFEYTHRPRKLLPLPWGLATLEAFFLNFLPKPLLTPDQVQSLKTDNVVPDKALTLDDLEIKPTGMGLILPSYLARFQPEGKKARAC